MDIRVLAEFVSLVETRSFQETAAQMNVSQSTLSKHIQKLEDELGINLCIRSHRGVRISEYGNIYYSYARQIIQLQTEAVCSLEELNKLDKNVFSVVFDPSFGQYGLIDMIAAFSDKHPNCRVEIFERNRAVDFMRNRQCSFAFVDEFDAGDCNFNKLVYKTDHLAVIVPSDHSFADRDSVTLEDLAHEEFIIHSADSGKLPGETRKFQEQCAAAGFVPNIVIDSQLTSTIIHHVRLGHGIAVLNKMRIRHDLKGLRAIDIHPAVNTDICMLYPSKLPSPYAKKFLNYVKERAANNP